MSHLNNCFHCWHCEAGYRQDYMLLCSNAIPLQDLNQLSLRILNTVTYRDLENGRLAIGQGQVYMLHKCLQRKFKVHFLFNCCLDNQLRNASFDLQRLKLWILFTAHTSMVYNKWEWKIHHWSIKSTRHSLPSVLRPSTMVCWPGKQVCLGFCQSLFQEVVHNVSAIQETLIMRVIMHAQMYFVISTQISVVSCQRSAPEG